MTQQNAFLVTVVAAIALAAGIWFALDKPNTFKDTRVAALSSVSISDLELFDLNGELQNFNQWRNKLLLINFWATWCPPCLEEIPLFIELQKQYQNAGLQIVGVAVDTKENVKDFGEVMTMNYPIVLDAGAGMKIMERYGNRYGSLPYSIIVADGTKVIHQKLGAYKAAELETLIRRHLKSR